MHTLFFCVEQRYKGTNVEMTMLPCWNQYTSQFVSKHLLQDEKLNRLHLCPSNTSANLVQTYYRCWKALEAILDVFKV